MLRIFILSFLIILSACSQSSSDQSSKANNPEPKVEESKSSQIEQGKRYISNQSSGVIGDMFWGIFLIGISGGTYILYRKSKSNKNKIDSLSNKLDRTASGLQQINSKFIEIKNDIESNKKSYAKHKNDIDAIERKLSSIYSELGSKYQNLENRVEIQNEDEDTSGGYDNRKSDYNSEVENRKNLESTPDKTLFFSVPSLEGKFEHRKGQEEYEDRKMFKIIYQEGKSGGILEYVSGEYDGHAINNKDSILKPVCNIQKATDQNPTRIRMLKSGKVRLSGNEWVIQDKLKVEII